MAAAETLIVARLDETWVAPVAELAAEHFSVAIATPQQLPDTSRVEVLSLIHI